MSSHDMTALIAEFGRERYMAGHADAMRVARRIAGLMLMFRGQVTIEEANNMLAAEELRARRAGSK